MYMSFIHCIGIYSITYVLCGIFLLMLQDSGTDRILATRIQVLPAGSVRFDVVTSQVYKGVVAEELTSVPDMTTLENPLRLLFLRFVCAVYVQCMYACQT